MPRVIAWVALGVAILSLALNLILIGRLYQARGVALEALDHTSQRLDSLPDVSINYSTRVKQVFPVSGVMPLNQSLTVPISTTVPINLTSHVSVSTLLGPLDFPYTVNTTVPIRLSVPVTISTTVPYSLTVPLDMSVPVQVRLRDVGVPELVTQVKQELQRLRAALQ